MSGRKPKLVTANGVTRTIQQWSEISGIAAATIRNRLELGWDVETAVSEPPRKARGLNAKDPAFRDYKEPSHLNDNGEAVRKFNNRGIISVPRTWMADCGIFFDDMVLVRFCGDHLEIWPHEC